MVKAVGSIEAGCTEGIVEDSTEGSSEGRGIHGEGRTPLEEDNGRLEVGPPWPQSGPRWEPWEAQLGHWEYYSALRRWISEGASLPEHCTETEAPQNSYGASRTFQSF